MCIAGIVIAVTAATSAGDEIWFRRPSSQFIFHAVLEGLYEDGASNAVIDSIIPAEKPDGSGGFNHSFVYACPLCHPAYEAMRLYRQREVFIGQKLPLGTPGADTFGKGLPKPLEERLLSADELVRRPALQELIQRYVSRRVERLRLTDAERDELARGIEDGRKRGEQMLLSIRNAEGSQPPARNWMTCVVCDASFNACPRPGTITVPRGAISGAAPAPSRP